MTQTTEQDLIERIRKIEALFEGAATDGEQAAAQAALDRMGQRLQQEAKTRPQEFSFSIGDPWQRQVFCALLRKHGIQPFRYPRQKRQTVMARVPKPLLDQVLWPEFQQIASLLTDHLAAVAERVIAECIHGDSSDAQTAPEALPQRRG